MKKLLSVLLLSLFIFSFSYADDNKKVNPKLLEINLNFYKKKLKNKENGEKYIEVLDKKLFSFSEEKLKKLGNSIEEYLKTYKGKHFDLLKYAKFKIDIILMDGKTENKNGDLKIYRSEDFGFEITYKDDESIKIDDDFWLGFLSLEKEKKISTSNMFLSGGGGLSNKDFKIIISFYPGNLNLEDTLNEARYNFRELSSSFGPKLRILNGAFDEKVENTKIGGKDAYKVLYGEKGKELENTIYIVDGGYSIEVAYGEEYGEVVENILNSIKFFKRKDYSLDEFIKKKKIREIDYERITYIRSISSDLYLYFYKNNKLPDSLNILSKSRGKDSYIKDTKDGQTINGCKFGYTYEKISDREYRLSTCMESEYGKKQAKEDGGIYENKYEVHEKLKD